MNNVFLVVMMLTVLLGTLYPLVIDALCLGKISVGAPYFNTVFIPLILPLLFLMGVAPISRWKETNALLALKRLWWVLVVSVGVAMLSVWLLAKNIPFTVFMGVSVAFWILLTTLQSLFLVREGRLRVKTLNGERGGMLLGHCAVALCVLGITLSSAYSIERDVRVKPGDVVSIGKYHFGDNSIKA